MECVWLRPVRADSAHRDGTFTLDLSGGHPCCGTDRGRWPGARPKETGAAGNRGRFWSRQVPACMRPIDPQGVINVSRLNF